jgi:hypothetical protein
MYCDATFLGWPLIGDLQPIVAVQKIWLYGQNAATTDVHIEGATEHQLQLV